MSREETRRQSTGNLSILSKADSGFGARLSASEGGSLLYRFGHEVPSAVLRPLGGSADFSANDNFKGSEEESVLSQISSLTKIRPKNLKIVSGSQFRLTTKNFTQCENCEIFDRLNKKNKEVIRSLKLQLARLEESYKDLKFSRTLEHSLAESRSTTDQDHKGNEQGAPNRKVERLEEEVLKLKKMVTFERNTSEALRQSLEELRANYDLEITSWKDKNVKIESDRQSLEKNSLNMKEKLESLTVEINILRQEIEATRNKELGRRNSEVIVTEELLKLKNDVELAESTNKQLQDTLQKKLSLITQLEGKLAAVTNTLSSLEISKASLETEIQTLNISLKNTTDQVTTIRKRCEGLENSLKNANQEKDNVKKLVLEKDAIILDKNQKLSALESDLRAQNNKLNDLLKRMMIESETTKKALEKSIASSVRLCVVAPTVNVHVHDTKMKYKSKLPDSTLRSFLQDEIFEKYCFLFKQVTESSSPVSGENLEVWLQRMLTQMQSSIENHVNSAMEGSSM